MNIGCWASVAVMVVSSAQAADTFPDRQKMEGAGYTIEFSPGDEPYAKALVAQLPLAPAPAPPPAQLPFTLNDLTTRRAEVLELIGEQLALPPTTPKMQQVYDAFAKANAALGAATSMPAANRFALWHTEELQARLAAGQNVAGFRRAADGGLEVNISASLQFNEGEAPEVGLRRMREEWAKVVWPIKIGAEPGATPEAEVRERLGAMRQNLAGLGAYQSAEMQRMAVMNVLHETVESTLVDRFIRSADRRWFCEGVSNYVAFAVLQSLVGSEAAKQYYDVDAMVARNAALQDRVDLEHWPVAEDARAKPVPEDVTLANYAYATQRVFEAFKEEGTLAKVLAELGKTSRDEANFASVAAAYRKVTGRTLE